MYENVLSKILGINKNNYRNQEYILQMCSEYSINDVSVERLKTILCELISESSVFNTVMTFDEEGNLVLEQQSNNNINITETEVNSDMLAEFEEKLLHDVSWLDENNYLYRIVLVGNYNCNSIRMYMAFHHGIMDGIGIFNFLERIQMKISNVCFESQKDTNKVVFDDNRLMKNSDYWEKKLEEHLDSSYVKSIEDLGTIELSFTDDEFARIKNNKKDIMMATLIAIARTYPIFNYNECKDVVIDFATNLRKRDTVKELGMYVNILPIFLDDFYNNSLNEAELIIRKTLIGIFRHADFPVYEVGKSCSNIMFSYIPLSQYPCLNEHFDGKTKFTWLDTGRGPYDFAFSLFDGDNYIRLRIDYKKNKFETYEVKSYIKWIKEYIINYLTIDSSQRDSITVANWTPRVFENKIKVNELNSVSFEDLLNDTFSKNRERIAFTDGINQISYGELAYNVLKNAEQYEKKLEECDAIIIYGTPKVEMLVMMMTAIYMGVPYIFSGPKIPINTVKYLNDEFNSLFFSDIKLNDIETEEYPILELGKNDCSIEFKNPGHDILTYFCTSGTTGEPKVIPDKRTGMSNLINNKSNTYIEEGDTSLLISSLTFDLTIDPIYRSILKSGTLVLVDIDRLFNKEYLLDLVKKTGADTLLGTPSALSGICDEVYQRITKVGSVGETLTKALANRLNSFDNLRVFNCYGPTEATCYCHLIEVTGVNYSSSGKEVPIGYIIDGMQSIIVDPFDCEVPDGLPGELLLAGVGVLDDYYNYKGNDKVFSNIYEIKWYHSGDMCHYIDGLYYYIARKGNQVKINGYRVELSAIEKKLENYIDSAFKLMIINGILVVFHEGEVHDIQNRMSKELPAYMVPKKLIKLDQLPTNKNQKVNTKILEEIYKESMSNQTDLSQLNPIEKEIYTVFAEIIGIKNFGIDDSLYELGGNSFTIIQISNRLREKYSCIDFEIVMQHMSLKQLAEYISNNQNDEEDYLFSYDIKKEYKASKMQKSMILKQVINPNDTSYHIGVLISTDDLKVNINEIMDYCRAENEFHYRVSYHDNEFYMKYYDNFQPEYRQICVNDVDELPAKIKSFDLFNDTLVRYSDIIVNGKLEYYLFEMHHIISDGFTLQNSLDELINGRKANERVAFWSAVQYFENMETATKEQSQEFIENLKIKKNSVFSLTKQEKTIQKHHVLDSTMVTHLYDFIKNNSLSVQACISTLLVSVLNEMNYLKDIDNDCIIGTPVNLRNCAELESAYGPMIQMLPVVVSVGDTVKHMEKTRIAISDTMKNKFLSYEYIVNECEKNLFELVITSFRKYDEVSGKSYNQNISLYPDKFGTTIFIYEGKNEIEIVISSYYLTEEMINNVVNNL